MILVVSLTAAGFAGPAASSPGGGDEGLSGDDHSAQRVVNGEVAPPGSWPSIVRVGGCGGTLVEPDWVLTAAHCGVREGAKVVLGRHDLTDDSVGEEIRVADSFRHPRYSLSRGPGIPFDYALLHLERSSDQPVMAMAAADRSDDPIEDELVAAAGWGITEAGKQTKVLRQTTLEAWSDEDCRAARNTSGRQDPLYNLCALHSVDGEPVRDTCGGDSGGPLTVDRDGVEILVGMTSYGPFPCARRGAPGVYARVSNARGWIAKTSGRHAAADFSELSLDAPGPGEIGEPSVISLRSDGAEAVAVAGIEIDPGFELTGGTCAPGSTLAPSESCTLLVAANGSDETRTGELRISTDSDDEPVERVGLTADPAVSPLPDTAIIERPETTVRAGSARARLGFAFTSTSPGASFECAFGRGGSKPRFRPCESPARFTAEAKRRPSRYLLRVRATDEAGADRTPAAARVLVSRRR